VNLGEIRDSVNFNIKAIYPSAYFLDAIIDKQVNRLMREIASQFCLRALLNTRTIDLSTETLGGDEERYEAKGKMPRDYDHDMIIVHNATTGLKIERIYQTVTGLDRDNSVNEIDSVDSVATDGTYLYGRPCPEIGSDEEISITYYRVPDDLENDDDEPNCLPVALHEGLLVDGATARLLKRVKEEAELKYNNMQYHLNEHSNALAKLAVIAAEAPKTIYYFPRTVQYF